MQRTVKIGGACAFFGDSSIAPPQLLAAGVDYLAEAAMSSLGANRAKRADLGYASDFTEWVWKDNRQELKRTGTRIVTNAGGVNPRACRERMERHAAAAGLSFRIAVVEGDDLLDRVDAVSGRTEMFTQAAFPPRDKVVTANAYLGAFPIARALAMGGVTGKEPESAVYRCAGDDEWCVVTVRDMTDEAAIARLTGGVPLADWMAQQEPRAAMEVLQAGGVAAGAMLRVAELPEFDYYVERGFFREASHPHMPEPFVVEGPPVRSERLADPLEVPAPLPGEHTSAFIRERLGLSQTEIDALIAAKALEQFTMPEGTAA